MICIEQRREEEKRWLYLRQTSHNGLKWLIIITFRTLQEDAYFTVPDPWNLILQEEDVERSRHRIPNDRHHVDNNCCCHWSWFNSQASFVFCWQIVYNRDRHVLVLSCHRHTLSAFLSQYSSWQQNFSLRRMCSKNAFCDDPIPLILSFVGW